MLLFAVTAVEQMKTLPAATWAKIGIAVAALIIGVFVLRKLMKTNKVVAGIAICVVGTVVFFSWVYNRNEPKFLTPLVNVVAPFFPSANSYGGKNPAPAKR